MGVSTLGEAGPRGGRAGDTVSEADRGAQEELAPAGQAPLPGPPPVAARVVLGLLVVVAAVALAIMECFLVPLRVGTVPLPVSVPLAVAGNVVLARLAARVTGRGAPAVVPPVLWLAVVLVLAAPRPEGDVVVPGSATALAFLFAGAVAGAYGAASTAVRRPNPTFDAGG